MRGRWCNWPSRELEWPRPPPLPRRGAAPASSPPCPRPRPRPRPRPLSPRSRDRTCAAEVGAGPGRRPQPRPRPSARQSAAAAGRAELGRAGAGRPRGRAGQVLRAGRDHGAALQRSTPVAALPRSAAPRCGGGRGGGFGLRRLGPYKHPRLEVERWAGGVGAGRRPGFAGRGRVVRATLRPRRGAPGGRPALGCWRGRAWVRDMGLLPVGGPFPSYLLSLPLPPSSCLFLSHPLSLSPPPCLSVGSARSLGEWGRVLRQVSPRR